MLEIINERGETMELDDDIRIPVERNNPLFNDADKFFQDISYPGKAPLSPNNKAFFKSGHLVDAPNSVYEFSVVVKISGFHFFSAVLSYKFSEGSYDFVLKVNYGSVAQKVKKTRLTELRTNDGNAVDGLTNASLSAHMLDTVTNPENHPYVFVPVHNPFLYNGEDTSGHTLAWVNYFDYALQTFKIGGQELSGFEMVVESPYYKLQYILKQILNYLGFNTAGSFLSDPEFGDILVYTRKALNKGIVPKKIVGSMKYMPNITIEEALKNLRERIHFGIDFDLKTGTATVETFESIKAKDEVINLADYIESVDEIEPNSKKGYTISLKADEQDKAHEVLNGGEPAFLPTHELIIGDGQNKSEINCGTLKAGETSGRKYPVAKQAVLTTRFLTGDKFTPQNPSDISTFNNWPLRLLRYKGLTTIETDKVWPEAEPYDLGASDISWYRFLNDSKSFKLTGSFPPDVLDKLGSCNKISFISKEGTYVEALIEKVNFDLSNSSRIRARILAVSLNYDITTTYMIKKTDLPTVEGLPEQAILQIKAFFVPAINAITKVDFTAVGIGATFEVETIVEPTDYMGAGGTVANVSYTGVLPSAFELRVLTGKPKYIDYFGTHIPFIQEGSYYKAMLTIDSGLVDYDVAWVVF